MSKEGEKNKIKNEIILSLWDQINFIQNIVKWKVDDPNYLVNFIFKTKNMIINILGYCPR